MEDQLQLLSGRIVVNQRKRINEFDAVREPTDGKLPIVISQGDLNNSTEVFSTTDSGQMIKLQDHGSSFTNKKFGRCCFIDCQTLDGKETLDGIYLVSIQDRTASQARHYFGSDSRWAILSDH